MNPIYANLPTTIFEVMSGLARETGAINLGQGFPDEPGPEAVRRKAAEAVVSGWNQYPPMRGLPELREAVAGHYKRFQGLDLDWQSEVTVTSGATEALAASIFALISPGDEVVLFQPLYDAYAPLIRRAGGTIRLVRLEPPDWRITRQALEVAFTPKTRLVVFNNPLNPAAVVFPAEELALLAEFCVSHDAGAICDEVWEQVVFDNHTHASMLGIPGMRERTVKIGSAGKMFALTGWKVGFVCACPELSAGIAKAHQFLTFTTPPNLQAAVAGGVVRLAELRWVVRGPCPGDLGRSLARPAGARPYGRWVEAAAQRRNLFPECRSGRLRHRDGRSGVLSEGRERLRGRLNPGFQLLRGRAGDQRYAPMLRKTGRHPGPGGGTTGPGAANCHPRLSIRLRPRFRPIPTAPLSFACHASELFSPGTRFAELPVSRLRVERREWMERG